VKKKLILNKDQCSW